MYRFGECVAGALRFQFSLTIGEGKIGKLLKAPAIYNSPAPSSAEITKLLYDLRQDPRKHLTVHFHLF
jgi:hypothetical protein